MLLQVNPDRPCCTALRSCIVDGQWKQDKGALGPLLVYGQFYLESYSVAGNGVFRQDERKLAVHEDGLIDLIAVRSSRGLSLSRRSAMLSSSPPRSPGHCSPERETRRPFPIEAVT